MDRVVPADCPASESELATDLLASLLMENATAPSSTSHVSDRLPPKVYAVMVLTSLLTFATLAAGYQLLFSNQLFA
ncbi:MAG TPA: hypothetical protein VHE36_10060 [Sphingomicrobium sp.]|jgi:hypothetical protein|nr:hypothetical protein [Sphingomicrobium sp.]